MQSFQAPEELERIPNTSGLYYFYDQNDKLLYIGKAKNLHSRIFDHHKSYEFHREGIFFHKILISKGLLAKVREEWPKDLADSVIDFEFRGLSKKKPLVIDYVFNKIKRIKIEEMPSELTKAKERENIQKFKPLLNYEMNSKEYNWLDEHLE